MKSTFLVASVSVKTGIRLLHTSGPYGGIEQIPTVELWVGGRKFVMDCDSKEHAQQQVIEVARDLGIKP